MKKDNPFGLDFGLKPLNYISRLKQFQDVIDTFQSERGGHVYTITGARGTGKTVMLTSASDFFEQKGDWIVVELLPEIDMLDQLASRLYDLSLAHRIFNGKAFGFSFQGLSFSISGDKPLTNITSLLEQLFEKISSKNKKVLICVDEVANNHFVKPFVQAFQYLLRKNYPVYLLMTGLYQNIYELQNDKTMTFLYRSPRISLEPLSIHSIAESYSSIFKIDMKKAIEVASLTNGYAYAYQVLGHLLWEKGNVDISDANLISSYDRYLKEFVYDKIWSECSSNDRFVLRAFDSNHSASVESLMGKTGMGKNVFSVYRDRLIKRGILYSQEYGKLKFLLPRFYEFIQIKKLEF